MIQRPTWTDSLACCAYLRDAAREAGLRVPATASGWPHSDHWDAYRAMTEVCRRFLPCVEAETRTGRS